MKEEKFCAETGLKLRIIVSAASKSFEKLRGRGFSMVFAIVGQVFGWQLTIESMGSPTINPCPS